MTMTASKTDGAKVFAAWHNHGMADKHPKRPRDPNQLAKSIIDIATSKRPDRDPSTEEQGKDPAAVALGREGRKARVRRQTSGRRRRFSTEAVPTG